MADTLRRVAGPTLLGSSAATVYTVPALTVTTVRAIHVTNETGTDRTVTLSVGTDGAGKRFFAQFIVAAHDAVDWTGVLVLAAGEILQAYGDAGSALTLFVSGVESA